MLAKGKTSIFAVFVLMPAGLDFCRRRKSGSVVFTQTEEALAVAI